MMKDLTPNQIKVIVKMVQIARDKINSTRKALTDAAVISVDPEIKESLNKTCDLLWQSIRHLNEFLDKPEVK